MTQRISFLGGPLPPSFRLRVVTLRPHGTLEFRADDWADALVVVEAGRLEVECCSGTRVPFGLGAVLAFVGLPVRRLHNPGRDPLVLSAVSRRQCTERTPMQ